jgi:hypothetical protein
LAATITVPVPLKDRYLKNLADREYGPTTPAFEIIARPGHELWEQADENLARALTHNFYEYGRAKGWRWITDCFNGSRRDGNLGVPLLKGTINETNCGGFNSSVKRLADEILEIKGFEEAFTSDVFVTKPALQTIDASWVGNVRTLERDFAAFGAFFFSGHHWNRMGREHFDATTDSLGFTRAEDLEWCKLAVPPRCNYSGIWSVTVNRPPKPYGEPTYVVVRQGLLKRLRHLFPAGAARDVYPPHGIGVTQTFIDHMPLTSGVWPTLLLVARTHLAAAFRKEINCP